MRVHMNVTARFWKAMASALKWGILKVNSFLAVWRYKKMIDISGASWK